MFTAYHAKYYAQELIRRHASDDVAGVVVRFLEDREEQYRSLQKCERWSIVVPRVCGVPSH